MIPEKDSSKADEFPIQMLPWEISMSLVIMIMIMIMKNKCQDSHQT